MCHLCQNMWGNKQAAPPWSLEFKCSIDLGRKSKVLWKWCVCVHACSQQRKWREMWRDRENSTTVKYSFSTERWNKIKNHIQMSATPRWGNGRRAIEGWGQGKGTAGERYIFIFRSLFFGKTKKQNGQHSTCAQNNARSKCPEPKKQKSPIYFVYMK